MIKSDLGAVTAYADAVAHGYTGTREDFGKLLAGAGQNLADAAAAKDAAEAAADNAGNAAQTATDAAGTAGQAASAAANSADAASTSAGAAAQSAEAAETAQQGAENAAKKAVEAKTGAENALKDADTAKDAASGYADAATESATAAAASATNAAGSAKSASDAAQKIEDSAAKIEENEKAVSQLKEDNVTLSSKLEKNEKRAERAEATAQYAIKMQQGYTYDCKTVVGSGSEIDVPVGAKDFAGIRKIGGMSRKGYQILQDNFPASSSQLSVTKNGNYNYTLTTLSTGVYKQSSKTVDMTGLAGMYMLHAEIVGTGGLIVRFYSRDEKKIVETTIVSDSQEKTISIAEDFEKIVLVFLGNHGDVVSIGTTTTISNIMLELGNTAHRWEPYTTDLIEAPVDSVVSKKKSGEVIRTTALPPEMRALCPDYGQGTTESYNYIDFEAKSYHHVGSMTQNGVWTALDATEIIDLSAAWPDDLEILTVVSGGTVQMHYPKLDDDFEVAVPSETVFLVEIAKVI